MKALGYRTAIPTPAQAHIGDIYSTTDFRRPYWLLRHNLTEKEIDGIMSKLQMSVAVPNSSGDSSWNISVSADVVSYVKADLEANGARKFKVSYSNVNEYVVPETFFEDVVFPKIEAQAPGRDFKGKYAVIGLLEVGKLEYEFYNEKGGKIALVPGSELVKDLTAKLGAGWKVTNTNTLAFTQPHFLGYRMGRIEEGTFIPKGFTPPPDGTAASPAATGISVDKLSRKEMNNFSSEMTPL
jgi:hypothetical protein